MLHKAVRNIFKYHEVKTLAEFNKLVGSIKTPYVLDFYASWCGPCKMLWPVVQKRESESNGKWTLIKVDIDLEELAPIVNDHQVTGVPTLAFYKENKKIYQRVGFADDAAFKKLEEKPSILLQQFIDKGSDQRSIWSSIETIFAVFGISLLFAFSTLFHVPALLRQIKQEVDKSFIKFLRYEMSYNESHIDLLFNDLYQFTCSYSYFQNNKHEDQATFQVFFRKYPFGGQYVIFAGLEAVRSFIENLTITQAQVEYLKEALPNLSQEYIDWIKQDFRQRIKVNAFKEGAIVFAKEPLISYTGPLAFVQLLETPILNLVGFASLVATNASRMCKAVHPKSCLEFGLRRAQGPNGGLSASAYAYLGGFAGTSNTKASQLYKIPCIGSMSHAFITSFTSLKEVEDFHLNGVDIPARALEIRKQLGWKTHDGELASFLGFAKAFPHNFKTLVDTYNTLESGILNTIIVGKALIESGIKEIGIRLDSGDLCELSKACRAVWNKYIPDNKLVILASDDLNEEKLIEMENKQSEIDFYAVGTNIATCKKQPALGLVCKLTEINGTPKMKFSSDPEKATFPGKKVVYRIWSNTQKSSFDLLALEGEDIHLGEEVFYDSSNLKQVIHLVTKIERLNNAVAISQPGLSLSQAKQNAQESLKLLPESIFKLSHPQKYRVLTTKHFFDNLQKTMNNNSHHKI